MNGLDMLNTAPSGAAAGQAVAARAGDAGPDDPGGDASRSFNALLAKFDEPAAAAAEAPVQPAIPGFATPPSAVLRQALQITSETAADNAVVDISSADSASADEKTSASDDLALTDLVGDSKAPTASSQADAAPSLQAGASWSAAVNGAAGLMVPALIGVVTSPTPASLRQPDAPARGDQRLADGAMTDGLSADVGRLLDAAAGATEAVLSNGAAAQGSDDLILNANVTVLRTETHLPPVTPTTPLHQVVAAITTDGLGAPAEPAAAGAPDPATAPERQLVRTLDIRLEPPDLGSVTVKLRLTGQHLTLRISADSAATAQSLEQDRDTLASMLRGNGYSPEISAVRHEPAAAPTMLTASGADSAASSQSGANQAGSQGSTDGGTRSQSGQPGNQQQPQPGFAGFEPTDGHDADVQDTAARSGLYL
jgi:flagellar hook-length control protein FliK